MGEKERFSPPAVGGSSLLVIFAVLCLTVFALLGLATVQANGRLADASAQAVAAYYEADCQAEAILARLRAGETPDEVTATTRWTSSSAGDTVYSYVCPISDGQSLVVEVTESDGAFTILRWQAVADGEWTPNDQLNLWTGDPVQ